MNHFELNRRAQGMADTTSDYALARSLITQRQENRALIHLVACIRRASGADGKLLQDELVDHIAELNKKVGSMEQEATP